MYFKLFVCFQEMMRVIHELATRGIHDGYDYQESKHPPPSPLKDLN